MVDREEGGRLFRAAWIKGVNTYYPGVPKPGYVAPWEDISEWEKESIMEIYQQVHALILAGAQQVPFSRLTREQGGRLIRICWIAQVYKHIPNPKPAYVCNWEDLLPWEQETDMDIFADIEKSVL